MCKTFFNIFFNRTAPAAASDVRLTRIFMSGTKTCATVSDIYQIQLKESICWRENQCPNEGDNSWIFLSSSFSIPSDEMVLSRNMSSEIYHFSIVKIIA